MQNVYVILGAGRTGSNWLADVMSYRADHQRYLKLKNNMKPAGICHAIKADVDTKECIEETLKFCNTVVVHTHNKNFLKDFNLDPKNVTLIISKRRDMFAALMSNAISRRTKESVGYTNKKIEPFSIDANKFLALKLYVDKFYDDINLTLPYKKTTTIFYEDMLQYGVPHLMEKLNIPPDTIYTASYVYGRSPYDYKRCVLNWEELFNIYALS